MTKMTTIATALAISLATPGLLLAQDQHDHSSGGAAKSDAPEHAGGQVAMMQNMMGMMTQMHNAMMGGHAQGNAMDKDRSVMKYMMGPGMRVMSSPETGREVMLAKLNEFDANNDGVLSLVEFETLHAAMIRETTVDRFQHLDADGDGAITEAEIAAPIERMRMPSAATKQHGQVPQNN